MLRMVAVLLLLANGAFYAWTSGWLTGVGLSPNPQREPERLTTQLEPDALRLLNGEPVEDPRAPISPAADLPPVAAAPTLEVTPAQTCWQATGFTPAQAQALRAALDRSGLDSGLWRISEVRSGGRWVVYMGRYNDEQLQKKKAELRALKIDFREVNLPSAGQGLALGTFSSEEAVQQALKDVARKGVRSARTAVERPDVLSMTLRLPAVTQEQRASVEQLGDALAGKPLQRCD